MIGGMSVFFGADKWIQKRAPFGETPGFYRKGLVALGLLLALQLVLMIVIQSQSEEILFNRLDSDGVADAVDYLKMQGIAYRLTDEGTTVRIKGKAGVTRKEFEEWQKQRISVVGQENQVDNPQASSKNPDPQRLDAIRKELEKLLSRGSDHIEWARVGFRQRDRLALEGGEGKKGAAVMVGTGGAELPGVDVERIQWVVANSFAGLKPSDVVVLDEGGRDLTEPTGLEN